MSHRTIFRYLVATVTRWTGDARSANGQREFTLRLIFICMTVFACVAIIVLNSRNSAENPDLAPTASTEEHQQSSDARQPATPDDGSTHPSPVLDQSEALPGDHGKQPSTDAQTWVESALHYTVFAPFLSLLVLFRRKVRQTIVSMIKGAFKKLRPSKVLEIDDPSIPKMSDQQRAVWRFGTPFLSRLHETLMSMSGVSCSIHDTRISYQVFRDNKHKNFCRVTSISKPPHYDVHFAIDPVRSNLVTEEKDGALKKSHAIQGGIKARMDSAEACERMIRLAKISHQQR